jgi:bifunctional DNA-binding transcriptional regulator/antitoxin component of YhaV-PrlF toxin-antitoxin module
MRTAGSRLTAALCVPVLLVSISACDIVTADFKSRETAEWRKSYELQPGGRVEVTNINGKIEVEPSSGNTVEIVALKVARAASPEDARQALQRIEIIEDTSPSSVRIETKLPRGTGLFRGGNGEVRYTVRVPTSADVRFTTVNGGIELLGLKGRVNAETTNGGIRARDVGGPIDASTTNGGVDVELTRVAEPGVRLECTNGGIKLRLPSSAKATISASVTNGGIDADGLAIDTTESSRRRLEGRLNGGGPNIRIAGTNGGITIAGR